MTRKAEIINQIKEALDDRPKGILCFLQDADSPNLFYQMATPGQKLTQAECSMIPAKHHIFILHASKEWMKPKRQTLLDEVRAALRSSREDEYSVSIDDVFYRIADIDLTKMRPLPGAKGIKRSIRDQVYLVSGAKIHF